MTVTSIWLPGYKFTLTSVGYTPQGKIQLDGRASEPATTAGNPWENNLRDLLVAAGLCNNARLVPRIAKKPAGRSWAIRPKQL